jgi:succinyl-CoA synthetase beta subunit
VDLFEYQARDLFEANSIPVLKAKVATTPAQARDAAQEIGGKVVVKAQVKIGGRGKAGGVKLAENGDDAYVNRAIRYFLPAGQIICRRRRWHDYESEQVLFNRTFCLVTT